MKRRIIPRAGLIARAIAVLGTVALVAAPLAPEPEAQSPPTMMQEVRLSSVTVPPGGLVTSFVGKQFRYCAIICPLLLQTVVTAAVTTARSPVTFLASLPAGDLLKAIGAAAASVTGPTNAVAQAAILADGTRVAPRALNAFEVGVVGLLDVIPAAADGLPGIARALQTAREDTFTALNVPIVPNPNPTVTPEGVLQVAVVEAINVGAAVIFPAFNHVLSAIFDTPDAIAQELAATGNLVRAVAAGFTTVARHLIGAGTVVAESVVTALRNVGAAIEESRPAHKTTEQVSALARVAQVEESPYRAVTPTPTPKPTSTSDRDPTPSATAAPVEDTDATPHRPATTTRDDTESADTDSTPDVVEDPSDEPHRSVADRPGSSGDHPGHTDEADTTDSPQPRAEGDGPSDGAAGPAA